MIGCAGYVAASTLAMSSGDRSGTCNVGGVEACRRGPAGAKAAIATLSVTATRTGIRIPLSFSCMRARQGLFYPSRLIEIVRSARHSAPLIADRTLITISATINQFPFHWQMSRSSLYGFFPTAGYELH